MADVERPRATGSNVRSDSRRLKHAARTEWNIELTGSPDEVLCSYEGLVVSSDSVVIDESRAWLNLAAGIINARVPDAWKVDLRPGSDTTAGGRAN